MGGLHTAFELCETNELNDVSITSKQENVFLCQNVANRVLAKACRTFLMTIPFDMTRKECNDTDMPVLDYVYKCLVERSRINHERKLLQGDKYEPDTLPLICPNPNNWLWERYSSSIWRAAPKTLEDFRFSPVFDYITHITHVWKLGKFGLNIDNMFKATWVIQRVHQGDEIGFHNDYAQGRQIAFVFYLTPDDWRDEDGGLLKVRTPESEQDYIPHFNSGVIFKMINSYSPLHKVTRVRALDDKPRISLVGFWNTTV